MEELDSLGLLATESRPQPRELQYEDLSKLTYLNLVIKVHRLCQCFSHASDGDVSSIRTLRQEACLEGQ